MNPARLLRAHRFRLFALAAALAAPFVAPLLEGAAPPPLATSVAHADPAAWERVRVEDGIVVEKREIPGSPVIAFRGSGVIDAPILLVGSVVIDTTRAPEWVDSLKEARQIRKISDMEIVQYNHIATPIVMKDREFVLNTKLELDDAQKRLVIRIRSVDDPAAPHTSYVRGEIMSSSFAFTSIDGGRRTRVETEIHCDPKGDVAKWIVNMVQKNWPYNTITRLRAQTAKKDIKVSQELSATLTEHGFFR